MNLDFMDRRRAERFAELLDETGSGRHHSRGPADSDLAELVAIGHSLSAVRSTAQVESEFRTGLRAMLVATAERDGIGVTAGPVATDPIAGHAAMREPRSGLLGSFSGRRIRARGAIVIGVAAGAMAVSGISAASENAAPGDALYGVKRSTERAQLAMAGSDVTRGQLSLDFARTRLTEAAALAGADGGFGGVFDDMDADTRQGVKLLTEAAVARSDKTPLSRIDAFVAGQRQTFAPLVDRLDPADRERAQTSITLLDDVQERAEELRTGLACATPAPAESDALGPRLRDCMAGKDATTTTDQGDPGHGQKQGSKPGAAVEDAEDEKPAVDETKPARPGAEKTDPAETVEPDATAPVNKPGDSRTKVAPTEEPTPDAPAAEQPSTPTPAPTSEEEDGVIDGLLRGIFGG